MVEAARNMAGLTMGELWLDYMALGGNVPSGHLGAMMTAAEPMPRGEYNLLAMVLNERFTAVGCGSPMDYDGRQERG